MRGIEAWRRGRSLQLWIRPPHSGMLRSNRRLPTPSPRDVLALIAGPKGTVVSVLAVAAD
jgi:hypothetical protein